MAGSSLVQGGQVLHLAGLGIVGHSIQGFPLTTGTGVHSPSHNVSVPHDYPTGLTVLLCNDGDDMSKDLLCSVRQLKTVRTG